MFLNNLPIWYGFLYGFFPRLSIVHFQQHIKNMVDSQMTISLELYELTKREPRCPHPPVHGIVVSYLLQPIVVDNATNYVHLIVVKFVNFYFGISSQIDELLHFEHFRHLFRVYFDAPVISIIFLL